LVGGVTGSRIKQKDRKEGNSDPGHEGTNQRKKGGEPKKKKKNERDPVWFVEIPTVRRKKGEF